MKLQHIILTMSRLFITKGKARMVNLAFPNKVDLGSWQVTEGMNAAADTAGNDQCCCPASSIPSFCCFPTPPMHFDAMQCNAMQCRGGFQLILIRFQSVAARLSRDATPHWTALQSFNCTATALKPIFQMMLFLLHLMPTVLLCIATIARSV